MKCSRCGGDAGPDYISIEIDMDNTYWSAELCPSCARAAKQWVQEKPPARPPLLLTDEVIERADAGDTHLNHRVQVFDSSHD